MCMNTWLRVYVHTTHLPGAFGGQKRDPLLQTVVRCHVGFGKQILRSSKSSTCSKC